MNTKEEEQANAETVERRIEGIYKYADMILIALLQNGSLDETNLGLLFYVFESRDARINEIREAGA